jgi:glycine hydroxymethyltransferase
MVPFDTESPFVTSGIRIGTSAITTRGAKEHEMSWMVDQIDRVLMNKENQQVIGNVRKEVNEAMHTKPLFSF